MDGGRRVHCPKRRWIIDQAQPQPLSVNEPQRRAQEYLCQPGQNRPRSNSGVSDAIPQEMILNRPDVYLLVGRVGVVSSHGHEKHTVADTGRDT